MAGGDRVPNTDLIPLVETDRLLLRAFIPGDLESFADMVADPQVIKYASYSGQVMSRGQAWNWMCLMLGHWHMRGFGIWAVEERETGLLIGRIGIQHLEWLEEAELVWMLGRSSWGKGYATEGVTAAVDFGFKHLELPRLSAVIHPENQRSINLAERLGMTKTTELDREGIHFYKYQLESEAHGA